MKSTTCNAGHGLTRDNCAACEQRSAARHAKPAPRIARASAGARGGVSRDVATTQVAIIAAANGGHMSRDEYRVTGRRRVIIALQAQGMAQADADWAISHAHDDGILTPANGTGDVILTPHGWARAGVEG